MTDFVQQAKDLLAKAGYKVSGEAAPVRLQAPSPRRALTADEQAKVDAFTDRLTAPPPDTGKEGNAHWLAQPHGAADAHSPHHIGEQSARTLADFNEEMEERAEDQANNELVVRPR